MSRGKKWRGREFHPAGTTHVERWTKASGTVTSDTELVEIDRAADAALTLPAISSYEARRLVIRDCSGNAYQYDYDLTANGTDTIGDNTEQHYYIREPWGWVVLEPDTTDSAWRIAAESTKRGARAFPDFFDTCAGLTKWWHARGGTFFGIGGMSPVLTAATAGSGYLAAVGNYTYVRTSAVANNTVLIRTSGVADESAPYRWQMQYYGQSSVADLRFYAGCGGSITASDYNDNDGAVTNGFHFAGFRFATGVDGNLYTYVSDSVTSTATDTGITLAAGTNYILDFQVDGDKILWNVWSTDGALLYNALTEFTDSPTGNLYSVFTYETLAAATKEARLTYCMLSGTNNAMP